MMMMMMMIIWVLTLCGLVDRKQRFGETYWLHICLRRWRLWFSETLVSTQESTWRKSAEHHLYVTAMAASNLTLHELSFIFWDFFGAKLTVDFPDTNVAFKLWRSLKSVTQNNRLEMKIVFTSDIGRILLRAYGLLKNGLDGFLMSQFLCISSGQFSCTLSKVLCVSYTQLCASQVVACMSYSEGSRFLISEVVCHGLFEVYLKFFMRITQLKYVAKSFHSRNANKGSC